MSNISFNYFFWVVFCSLCELASKKHTVYWLSPQGTLQVEAVKSKALDADSTFWPLSDWNNSSSGLTASCCRLPVLFCLSSEWHSHVPSKLNQKGTLCTRCVQSESRCYELPMTTLELIAIDGFVHSVLFISSSLVRACMSTDDHRFCFCCMMV